jgi:hypothetical protein
MAPILTAEDVVKRIAAECAFVDERGAVGIRLKPAAAIVRLYGEQFRVPRRGNARRALKRQSCCDPSDGPLPFSLPAQHIDGGYPQNPGVTRLKTAPAPPPTRPRSRCRKNGQGSRSRLFILDASKSMSGAVRFRGRKSSLSLPTKFCSRS